VWFGDQARVGQKNKITRRWAKRGSRPSAPHDQRTASTYIFGAICPKEGKAAGLILPWCNLEMMALFLAELSRKVAPGRHAVLLVDQAGWHTSAKLVVPANITIVPLPPKCPELNPQENVWQYLRDNWLSNRKRRPMAAWRVTGPSGSLGDGIAEKELFGENGSHSGSFRASDRDRWRASACI
jgi:hypothetical protein